MHQSRFKDAAGGHRPTLQINKITFCMFPARGHYDFARIFLGVTLALTKAAHQFVIINIYTFNVSKTIILDHT